MLTKMLPPSACSPKILLGRRTKSNPAIPVCFRSCFKCKWKGSCAIKGPRHPFLHFEEPNGQPSTYFILPICVVFFWIFCQSNKSTLFWHKTKQHTPHPTFWCALHLGLLSNPTALLPSHPLRKTDAKVHRIPGKWPEFCDDFGMQEMQKFKPKIVRCEGMKHISLIASENKGWIWSYLFNQDCPSINRIPAFPSQKLGFGVGTL